MPQIEIEARAFGRIQNNSKKKRERLLVGSRSCKHEIWSQGQESGFES